MRHNSKLIPNSKQLIFFISNVPVEVLIFCIFFLSYSLTMYGQLRYGDETERYLQAQSLIDRGNFQIPLVPGHQTLAPDGKNYSQFELGYGILLLPAYALGQWVNSFFSYPNPNWVPLLFVFCVNPAITAFTCVVLFRFCRALGIGEGISVWVVVIYGFGTMAWPYTKGLYREPIQALTLLLSVYGVYEFRRKRDAKYFWLSAIGFGYTVFTKVANLMMFPLFGLYLLFALNDNVSPGDMSIKKWFRQLLTLGAFIVPTFVLLAFQGWVNFIKYQNPFDIGPANYQNPLPYFSLTYIPDGVFGLLFSPEKSLFLYAPPTVLFIAAWIVFFRRNRIDSVFFLLLIAANIIFNGAYQLWGSVNWGPRYLVLILPLIIAPMGLLFQDSQDWKRGFWKAISVLTFLVGLGIQGVAALTDDRELIGLMSNMAELRTALDLFGHRSIDSLVIFLSPLNDQIPVNPWAWTVLALVGLLGGWLVVRVKIPSGIPQRMSNWIGIVFLLVVISLQISTFMIWVVAQYPTILQGKADTKFIAGNAYFAEGRFCEAQGLYVRSLFLGTTFAPEVKSKLETIMPIARGDEVEIGSLTANILTQDLVEISLDPQETLSGEASLRIRAFPPNPVQAEVDSEFFTLVPSARYELSGWFKAEGLYGMGTAVVGWYEDNGAWRRGRAMDIASTGVSSGWQRFKQTVTTLPTSRRALIKTSLWEEAGTFWVDGIRLVQVDMTKPVSTAPRCSEKPYGIPF